MMVVSELHSEAHSGLGDLYKAFYWTLLQPPFPAASLEHELANITGPEHLFMFNIWLNTT